MAETTQTLETQSVKSFMQEKGFTQIGGKAVRTNKSGYPYVTFIDANNVAENVYFSKGASELVGSGEVIGRGFFDQFNIAMVHNNAANALLPKLVRQGGDGSRLDIADLF